MLLTSGQISMGISSAIVFIFSTLLFLSGYVLQQRTVKDIQAIIHPPPDPKPASSEAQEAPIPIANIDWEKTAYVQLLQQYGDVCNAVIIHAELSRQHSLAKRVLLYPREWEQDLKSGQDQNRSIQRSMRLLRRATARYGISLRPDNTSLLGRLGKGKPQAMASIFSLAEFETVLYLRPSGFVVNAATLDYLFASSLNSSLTHFVGSEDKVAEPIAFLVHPSAGSHQQTTRSSLEVASAEQWAESVGFKPDQSAAFLASSSLRSRSFGETSHSRGKLLDSIGYVKFSDPEIFGPEFDLPYQAWVNARPGSEGARRIWESLYEQYRGQRMSVCGLDLEPLPDMSSQEQTMLEI